MGITRYQLSSITVALDAMEKIPNFKCGIFYFHGAGDVLFERSKNTNATSKIEVTFLDNSFDESDVYKKLKDMVGE